MTNHTKNDESANALSRRGLLGAAGLSAIAIAGHSSASAQEDKGDKLAGPEGPYAFIDGQGHGWRDLVEEDFAKVNSADDTWSWKDGVLYCTGKPISVMRTAKEYTNFEIVFEWNHRKPAGNSGLFVWAEKEKIEAMTKAGKPGLPKGIEVQVLDTAYNPKGQGTWFTSHGDVFPVGVKMTPFPPLSNNGKGPRSFPSEKRTRDSGNWNHYYVRGINGEVRLWVNGKEVSGGTNIEPRTGYLCLESEGSPIEFKNLRIRELP